MLNAHAKTGEAGNLASLSRNTLQNRNVRGNGHFQIDQDGHLALLRWVLHDRPESTALALSGQLGDLAGPTDDEGMSEEPPDAAETRTWVAYGASGEAAGKLSGPVQFVWKLMDFWRLDRPDAVRLLGYDPEDMEYVSAVLDGRRRLSGRDLSDRIAHLFYIRRTLWSLFRDLDVENDWLREKHSMLDGRSPLSLMLEGSMEDLLLAREYIESAAGIR